MKKENILILTIATIFLTGCGNKQNKKDLNDYFYLSKKNPILEEMKEEEIKRNKEKENKEKEIIEEKEKQVKQLKNEEKNTNKKEIDINEEELKNIDKNEVILEENLKDNPEEEKRFFVLVLDEENNQKIKKELTRKNFETMFSSNIEVKYIAEKLTNKKFLILKKIIENK